VYVFPSDAWIQALREHLNASSSYERAAKDWEGDFVFVVEPNGTGGPPQYLFLGLYHGRCTEAAMLTEASERVTEFTISAPLATWRLVVEGKLDPIQGLMTKKLKLQGNMMKIMRYPKAAKEIISCCALVPTDFGAA
jgi:putative sterol carrier protein